MAFLDHKIAAPAAVPSIAELTEHPQRAAELSPALAADLLGPCEAELARLQRVRDTLLIRAAVANLTSSPADSVREDLFDEIDEAARLVGRSRDFIYRNHRSLSFVVQEGRGRRLRFSRSGIERFLAANAGGLTP